MSNIIQNKITKLASVALFLFGFLLLSPQIALANHGTVNVEMHMIVDGAVINLPGAVFMMQNEYIRNTNQMFGEPNANRAASYAITGADGAGYFHKDGNSLATNCGDKMAYQSPGGSADASLWSASCEAPGIVLGGNPTGLSYISGANDNFCQTNAGGEWNGSPLGGYTCGIPCVHGSFDGIDSRHTKFYPYFPKGYFEYYRAQGVIPLGVQYDVNDIKGGGSFNITSLVGDGEGYLEYGNNNLTVPTINFDNNNTTYIGDGTANSEWAYIHRAVNGGSKDISWEWVPEAIVPVCGDGIINNDETCDPGSEATAVCSQDGQTGTCLQDCTCAFTPQEPECGDGVIDSGEECDPGDETTAVCSNGATCTNVCSCPDPENPSISKTGQAVCSATRDSSTVSYTLTVTNPTDAAITATITDDLDSDIDPSYVQASSISDGGTLTDRTITWTDIAIGADSSETFTYDVVFPDDVFRTEFTNTATLVIGGEEVDEAVFNVTPNCTGTIPETGIEDSPVFSILVIGLGLAMFILVSSEIMYGNISNSLGKRYNLKALMYGLSPSKEKDLYEEALQYRKPETKDLDNKNKKE